MMAFFGAWLFSIINAIFILRLLNAMRGTPL